MASNKLKLTDLKVSALRAELEERDLETSGTKSILQQRLREALLRDGEDPESYIFESELSKALEENSRNLETKLVENSRILKEELKLSSEENSRKLKSKLEENSKILRKDLKENSRILETKLEENSRKFENLETKL